MSTQFFGQPLRRLQSDLTSGVGGITMAMRSLNELISRNALVAIDRATKKAEEEGEKLNTNIIAKRMSNMMVRLKGPGREKYGDEVKQDTIRKALERYLDDAEGSAWRLDYLEAFSGAIGVPVERLISLDYTGAKVPELTYMQLLYSALGRRLSNHQARRVIRNIQRELDRPGMFELVTDLAEALLAAESKEQAFTAAYRILEKSAAWEAKSPRSGRKKKTEISSKKS